MFIYCFDAFLDNTTLYLLRQMTHFHLSIVFHGGESITYIVWAKFKKVMLYVIMDTTKGYFTHRNVVRKGIRK